MAQLLEDTPDIREGAKGPAPDALTRSLYGDAATPDPVGNAANARSAGEAIAGRMTRLVKGAGFVGEGGNTPLTDQTDILRRASQASLDLRMATREGYSSRSSVVKSFNPDWLNQRAALKSALTMPSIQDQLTQFLGAVASPDVVRSFTAGNLGIGSTE